MNKICTHTYTHNRNYGGNILYIVTEYVNLGRHVQKAAAERYQISSGPSAPPPLLSYLIPTLCKVRL